MGIVGVKSFFALKFEKLLTYDSGCLSINIKMNAAENTAAKFRITNIMPFGVEKREVALTTMLKAVGMRKVRNCNAYTDGTDTCVVREINNGFGAFHAVAV